MRKLRSREVSYLLKVPQMALSGFCAPGRPLPPGLAVDKRLLYGPPGGFHIFAIVNDAAVNMGCRELFESEFPFSSDKYLEVGLLDHVVVLVLIFAGPPYCFLYGCTNLQSHRQRMRFCFLYILTHACRLLAF